MNGNVIIKKVENGTYIEYQFYNGRERIGYIGIAFDKKNNSAEIRILLVYPKYRKKGYGKLILKEGIEKCKKCGKIYLYAQPCDEAYMKMEELVSFYEKFDFTKKAYYYPNGYLMEIINNNFYV